MGRMFFCMSTVRFKSDGNLKGSIFVQSQGMDNEERRCAEFVRELLDLRDGLLHVDILSQNSVLELIQIACTLWS